MLKYPVQCALGSKELKDCFPKLTISEDSIGLAQDNSMPALLRVMYPRIEKMLPEGANFHYTCRRYLVSDGFKANNNASKTRYFVGFSEVADSSPGLYILFVSGSSASDLIAIAKHSVEQKTPEVKNFRYDEFLSLYTDKTGRSAVFLNEKEKKTLCLFHNSTSTESSAKIHQSASALFRLLPWLFENGTATNDELELMKAFTYTEKEPLLDIFEKQYSESNMREKLIRAITSEFTSDWYQRKIQALAKKLNELNALIESKYKEIRDLRQKKEDDDLMLNAVRSKACRGETGDNELIEYILLNKEITLLGRNENSIKFAIVAPMENYDQDRFEKLLSDYDDDSSFVYSQSPYRFGESKALLNAIWGKDKQYTLMNYATYSIDHRAVVDTYQNEESESQFPGCVPNPHIVHMHCLGDYRDMLSQAEENIDFVGALIVCGQSARSINMSESVTVEKLMRDLWTTKEAVLRDAQGNALTVKQAVDQLKERGTV